MSSNNRVELTCTFKPTTLTSLGVFCVIAYIRMAGEVHEEPFLIACRFHISLSFWLGSAAVTLRQSIINESNGQICIKESHFVVFFLWVKFSKNARNPPRTDRKRSKLEHYTLQRFHVLQRLPSCNGHSLLDAGKGQELPNHQIDSNRHAHPSAQYYGFLSK